MSSLQWSLVEVASRLLERDEREAVLGDLVETQESAWNGVCSVIGLVVRRQALLWKSWRPWLAGFAVALPSSFLLMGASLSVSWSYQRLLCPELLKAASLTKGSGLLVLLCQAVLLIGWSWSGGYVVGAASRQTLWASALLCYSPCLFCLSRFRVESLSRFCLLPFLVPAIWGVRHGLRTSRLRLDTALVLALAVTALTLIASGSDGQRLWSAPRLNLDWALSLPAWYLVATSQRSEVITVRKLMSRASLD
ncbi:MAG: hypothetical protein WBL50_17195 [Candidatus Acidiferrum sp.]